MVNGNGLQPPGTGTTLRIRDGRRQVSDGPFADIKEQLGGYFILELPDLDTALDPAVRAFLLQRRVALMTWRSPAAPLTRP